MNVLDYWNRAFVRRMSKWMILRIAGDLLFTYNIPVVNISFNEVLPD